MKKATKIIALMLATLILTVMIIGCSEPGEIKEIDNSGNSPDNTNEAADNTPSAPISKDVSIEEQILLESNGVKITAKAYQKDSIWGDGIKLLIENNSDKDIGVGCEALIVNNFMITDLFSASVAAGKKSNETLYLSNSELEEAGISNIAQIEVYFYLYDSTTYDRIYEADKVTIKTSLYDEMDTSTDNSGVELYNKNGIKIIGKYVDENSFWGASALLYIENNSGENITVSADDVSVNGFMLTAFFSSTVYNEKMAIDALTFFSSDLEENDIKEIETIELKFRIYNPDTYSTIDETSVITINTK